MHRTIKIKKNYYRLNTGNQATRINIEATKKIRILIVVKYKLISGKRILLMNGNGNE
tara:strand:- start:788 stop:958 length:171 start_codon:yes stop_codon:yes gene_type:complete